MKNILDVILLMVSLVILGLTIAIYVKSKKENYKKTTCTDFDRCPTSFGNCVGVQYNGLNYLENKNGPLCAKGTKPLFKDGGCLLYDPQKVAIDYMEGKFRPAV